MFSPNWDLELYQQANARLHRIGQEHPVVIHHILTDGSMDERVLDALNDKDEVQQGLIEALKTYITKEEIPPNWESAPSAEMRSPWWRYAWNCWAKTEKP